MNKFSKLLGRFRSCYRSLILTFFPLLLFGFNWPKLSEEDVMTKIDTCLDLHAKWNELSPNLVERTIRNYLNYFSALQGHLDQSFWETWEAPSSQLIDSTLTQLKERKLTNFATLVQHATEKLEKMQRGNNKEQESFADLEAKAKNLVNGLLSPSNRRLMIHTLFLKAFVSALDSHSEYFTPDEFDQFMIEVQQETVGIGVVLESAPEGARIIEVIESGPADSTGIIFAQDIITHVNDISISGEPLDEIVKRLKGAENTSVKIRIQRTDGEGFDATLARSKVVLQRKRIEVNQNAFGSGTIAHISLHSFYASHEDSCAAELGRTIRTLKNELGDGLKAIVLDLRRNSGGLLRQGIEVVNLFVKAGVIVSIRDNKSALQLFRHFGEQTVWQGPLFVLVSRASASCSEIVAQALQDYGRALIIGDDRTYGKGSFQMFLSQDQTRIQTQGEIKLTRGMYYTVSGKSPQGRGVRPHIIVPGLTSQANIGEECTQFHLTADDISPTFDDHLEDFPELLRQHVLPIYIENRQTVNTFSEEMIRHMQKNSQDRILSSNDYQEALKKSTQQDDSLRLFLTNSPSWKESDFQLIESINVVKDYLYMDATTSDNEDS
ncbi:S41 family peptidase [Candidatus Similichlamydia epinepheli]|uniref:S41 family peptidase n=1 Tax=Candidatus Similichlamydia epinepheli TaxID=1903953 RepID=UPI000D3B4788|nr:S41 family peptidase [Candidatus Similichlamydia epinepheli]